jgi:hypothetical protein
MFKRVQKRQRKQKKEEELGLDSEMKEVLGLQDTDSEESNSSSDDSSNASRSDSDEQDAMDAGSDTDVGADDDEENVLESGEEGSESDDEIPPMSVTEAVTDPLYLVSMDPDIRACILCPGKLLKNPRMSDIHKASKVSALYLHLCRAWFNG